MKPSVDMGPPLPSRNPPPQGTRHCQTKTPALAGVLKLKLFTVWGPLVHGDVPHRFGFNGAAIGTLSPSPGIAKVCCTEQRPRSSAR